MGKGGHKLARGRIPELGGFVVACCGRLSAVGLNATSLTALMVKGGEELAQSRIPEIGSLILRACRRHSCARQG